MPGVFWGGPYDGEALDIPRFPLDFERPPWICVLKPKIDPGTHHLYLPNPDTDNYDYAGPCQGLDHDHYDIRAAD